MFWGSSFLFQGRVVLISFISSFFWSSLFVWLMMVSLFNGISTFVGCLMPKEQLCYYLTHSWVDKGVHTFLQGICQKVNVIARLEYELASYDSAVHRFNHYTTRTPLLYLLLNFDLKTGWLSLILHPNDTWFQTLLDFIGCLGDSKSFQPS